MLTPFNLETANAQKYWLPTTNLIMPKQFLTEFVNWYMEFVPNIIKFKDHPHYHERAINVYAPNYGFKREVIENGIEHLQMNSHEFCL
jgi:hypothetical protein